MNIAGTRIGDAMNLNFGVEKAHVRDTTATSGWICWWGQWPGFPKAIMWVAVEGSIRYSTKASGYQREQLLGDSKIDLKFAIRYIGVRSNRVSSGLQYPYYRGANQADVYYCINLPVDMGISMGMYNGVIRR